MDREAWRAVVHGGHRVRYDQETDVSTFTLSAPRGTGASPAPKTLLFPLGRAAAVLLCLCARF